MMLTMRNRCSVSEVLTSAMVCQGRGKGSITIFINTTINTESQKGVRRSLTLINLTFLNHKYLHKYKYKPRAGRIHLSSSLNTLMLYNHNSEEFV